MTRFVMCLAFGAGVLAAQGGQQAPVFRGVGESVPVYVTVTDKDNRLVPGLTREDFQIFDNGKPQAITVFDNTPQPVRIILMLDVSGSMQGNLPLLRAGSEQLFTKLLPGDKARVGTFGREIFISPTFTNDAAELRSALPTEIEPDAPTPLWKGTDQAMDALGQADGRRVVLVLSDGKDAPGFRKFGEKFISQLEIIERAQRDEVMIYGIGLRSRSAAPVLGNARDMLVADCPIPRSARPRSRPAAAISKSARATTSAPPLPASPKSSTVSTCSGSRRPTATENVTTSRSSSPRRISSRERGRTTSRHETSRGYAA